MDHVEGVHLLQDLLDIVVLLVIECLEVVICIHNIKDLHINLLDTQLQHRQMEVLHSIILHPLRLYLNNNKKWIVQKVNMEEILNIYLM